MNKYKVYYMIPGVKGIQTEYIKAPSKKAARRDFYDLHLDKEWVNIKRMVLAESPSLVIHEQGLKTKDEIEEELRIVKKELDEYPVPTIYESDSKVERYKLQIASFQGMEYALEWALGRVDDPPEENNTK